MKNKDKIAFVIGSGPSLNKLDLSKLKGQKSISLNRQYIAYDDWGFTPNYYLVCDRRLVQAIHKDIKNLMETRMGMEKFIILDEKSKVGGHLSRYKKAHGDRVVIANADKVGKSIIHDNPSLKVAETQGLSFCGNAGACAVHVLHLMGYEKIVLLGIDAAYSPEGDSIKAGKDLNHFRGDYFDVNKFRQGLTHGPDTSNSRMNYWKTISELMNEHENFNVYSSTPDSPINDVFEYVEFEKWFK